MVISPFAKGILMNGQHQGALSFCVYTFVCWNACGRRRMKADRQWARNFYISQQWIDCRKAYAKSKGMLCERCAQAGLIVPGEEVHHKIRLTPQNIKDPAVALNWDNLELLCKQCHLEEHSKTVWRTDEGGHVDLTQETRMMP